MREAAAFVGSDACRDCHAAEHSAWASSQHAAAMQPATATHVLAAFDGRTLRHRVERVRPVREDDKYWFEVALAGGGRERHAVRYTFGVYPLQQYLVEQADGRLQAFTWCWDARPAAQGGQRWFYLYPDDTDQPGSPLHWAGALQNWNHQCAECHATDVRKGYDAAAKKFDTRMAEPRVGCESCHGPASAHLAWARRPRAGSADAGDAGLVVRLRAGDRKTFVFGADDPIARAGDATVPAVARNEVESCGQCHARRGSLLPRHEFGRPLGDTHRVSLLEEPLYFADGQMQDEVFNYGSFLQGRMYQAGVTCGHCHEPHGGKLRAEGNAVCAQCHAATTFDTPAHHGHAPESGATACATCHMPVRTYMVVDPRHDHAFRRPDPLQSAAVGSPDVCAGCHARRDAAWAAAAIARWRRPGARPAPDFAPALHAARRWSADAPRRLRALSADAAQAPIVRASALAALAPWTSPAQLPMLRAALVDSDPLVREAAASWLEAFPPQVRAAEGAAALRDPVRSVRLAAVRAIASSGREAWPSPEPAGFRAALDEYRASLKMDEDRLEGLVGLGMLAAWEGDPAQAEILLRTALERDPESLLAAVNLADLLRARGFEPDAEETLRTALRRSPRSAELQHALGLLLARTQRPAEALEALGRAAALAPDQPRYAFVHGVALHDLKSPEAGIAALERAHRRAPGDPAILEALAGWHLQRGETDRANRYRDALAALWKP